MPGMLRIRSSWKSTLVANRSSRTSPAALKIEIAPDGQQSFEAVLQHDVDRPRAKPPIGSRHPAVREIAVVRKQDAQRLVDAEQVRGAVEQIAAVGERLAVAV